MRFSKQVYYGLAGVFDLAYNGAGRPVQVHVIATRQSIPKRYLEQIFQGLRKANLVRGKRGPGGGYQLAVPAAEISLLQIVEALEAPLGDGLEEAPEDSNELARANPASTASQPDFIWPPLYERISGLLADVSLAEICQDAARAGVPRMDPRPDDYQI